MPGTFNGTTLTISATPVDGALIPDKSATNVAGIAIVGSDMYCVKTTGLKTTLLKTTDYMATKATAVKKDLNCSGTYQNWKLSVYACRRP